MMRAAERDVSVRSVLHVAKRVGDSRLTEIAELPQSPDPTGRADAQHSDLNRVVPDDVHSGLLDRVDDDLLRRDWRRPPDTLAFRQSLEPLERRQLLVQDP
jgi:hypothetical protein